MFSARAERDAIEGWLRAVSSGPRLVSKGGQLFRTAARRDVRATGTRGSIVRPRRSATSVPRGTAAIDDETSAPSANAVGFEGFSKRLPKSAADWKRGRPEATLGVVDGVDGRRTMTRGSFGCAIALGLHVAALGVPGCACDGPSVPEDAAIDPSIDARGPDAWARPDADRGDAGPDAYDPMEDPCVTSPRSVDCARELLREIDAETCDAERACGRPITEEGCEAYFPTEGADLVRASEDELTLIRLGLLEIVPETVACLRERMRTCSEEDPNTCGPLFRPRVPPVEDRPCRLDAECGERLRCEGEEVGPRGMPVGEELCRVGRCVPRTADGEACEVELGIDDPIGPCLRSSVCLEGVCAPIVRPRRRVSRWTLRRAAGVRRSLRAELGRVVVRPRGVRHGVHRWDLRSEPTTSRRDVCSAREAAVLRRCLRRGRGRSRCDALSGVAEEPRRSALSSHRRRLSGWCLLRRHLRVGRRSGDHEPRRMTNASSS